jgi:hypothetical protein
MTTGFVFGAVIDNLKQREREREILKISLRNLTTVRSERKHEFQ